MSGLGEQRMRTEPMGYPPLLTANRWSCKKVSHDASAGNAVAVLGTRMGTSIFMP